MNANPINYKIAAIQPPTGDRVQAGKNTGDSGQRLDFQSLLQKALQSDDQLKFSKHVQARIDQRGIAMDTMQMDSLRQAVGLAEEKGIRDSLVVVQDAAFIVNVPSKTVITALNQNEMQQRVFTNIDGAVFY
ncbi:MAG: flagellar biosynthesis protein [Deferribacteres bacterium]|nr:flagellar biosynthesis protein [candidate division KSB1 bacterium]MCB9501929.1 flagellar biosynthesis protein [Deferribacteres bacterium]